MNGTRLVCLSGLLLIAGSTSTAQEVRSRAELMERASHEFAGGNYAEAERDFRDLSTADPSNVDFCAYLGHSLFRQQKYAAAIAPYEKLLDLERQGKALPERTRRIIVDQLAMAYGISGQASKAHELLEKAVSRDPEYPLNYYNLACVFAGGRRPGQDVNKPEPGIPSQRPCA